jgi:hypothetical protein
MDLVEKTVETAKTEKYSYMLKELNVTNISPCSQSVIIVEHITSGWRVIHEVTRK